MSAKCEVLSAKWSEEGSEKWLLMLRSSIRASVIDSNHSSLSLHSTWHFALALGTAPQLAFFIAIGRAYAFVGLCALLVSAFL